MPPMPIIVSANAAPAPIPASPQSKPLAVAGALGWTSATNGTASEPLRRNAGSLDRVVACVDEYWTPCGSVDAVDESTAAEPLAGGWLSGFGRICRGAVADSPEENAGSEAGPTWSIGWADAEGARIAASTRTSPRAVN